MDNHKRNILIGLGIGLAFLTGFFIWNEVDNRIRTVEAEKLEAKKKEEEAKKLAKLIKQPMLIKILTKARQDNYPILQKVSAIALLIAKKTPSSRVEPLMIKSILESPESPLNVQEQFAKVYRQSCQSFGADYENFAFSLEHYLEQKDRQIKILVDDLEKDYQTCLLGNMPEIKVTIPEEITADRVIDVYGRIALKKHLIQIDTFKKTRNGAKEGEILQTVEEEERKILQSEGFGAYNLDAELLYASSLNQHKTNPTFRTKVQKIDSHYARILNRYRHKIQTNRITESELNDLEDELIFGEQAF